MVSYEKHPDLKKIIKQIKQMNNQGESIEEMAFITGADENLVIDILNEI